MVQKLVLRLSVLDGDGGWICGGRDDLQPAHRLASEVENQAWRILLRQHGRREADDERRGAGLGQRVRVGDGTSPGEDVGDGNGGQRRLAQEGRYALVARPVIHSGVGVPLAQVDVCLDGAEARDRRPRGVVEGGRLPVPAGCERGLPCGVGEQQRGRLRRHPRRGGQNLGDDDLAVGNLDGAGHGGGLASALAANYFQRQDVAARAKRTRCAQTRQRRGEDAEVQAGRGEVGVEVVDQLAVEIDFGRARASEIERRVLRHGSQVEGGAEEARLYLARADGRPAARPDVLLGQRLVLGGRRYDQVACGVQRRRGLRAGEDGEKSERGKGTEKKGTEDAGRHGEMTIARRVGGWRVGWI